MAKRIIKCSQYDMLNTTPVVGQIYFCTDTRLLFKDNGPTKENRSRFNAIVLYTDHERLNSIKPTIGKFYYVEATNQLWLFDTRWVLKIGSNSTYNAYAVSDSQIIEGSYISPVINKDDTIIGPNGDKIIDNNGLLGDGSVGIRDSNRIIRGLLKSDNVYQQLVFNSYLDNGFLFIPNSHLPYRDLSTSLGALHLTVDRDISDINEKLDLSGQAYYYGTWNNYGDMYVINKTKNSNISVDYTPNIDKVIIKTFIKCNKMIKDDEGKEQKIITYITIRPVSSNQAVANIITLNATHDDTVAFNDVGELLYTDEGSLEENKTIECRRKITYENGYTFCTYYFDDQGVSIILKENAYTKTATIPAIWSDTGIPDEYYTSVWVKKKVLTDSDIDVSKDSNLYIKRLNY